MPGCAVSVACPSCLDHSPEPLGPGRIIRNMLGWSPLCAAGDWVRKGSYHTAWFGPLGFLVHLFVRVPATPRYRATDWKAVLATACRCVEGCRTPDEREPEPLSGTVFVCRMASRLRIAVWKARGSKAHCFSELWQLLILQMAASVLS